jgi:hypothetical protein
MPDYLLIALLCTILVAAPLVGFVLGHRYGRRGLNGWPTYLTLAVAIPLAIVDMSLLQPWVMTSTGVLLMLGGGAIIGDIIALMKGKRRYSAAAHDDH